MPKCKILKITEQTWSNIIFYLKLFAKNTRFNFDSCDFGFCRNSNKENIIKRYLQLNSMEREIISVKILEMIIKNTFVIHVKNMSQDIKKDTTSSRTALQFSKLLNLFKNLFQKLKSFHAFLFPKGLMD